LFGERFRVGTPPSTFYGALGSTPSPPGAGGFARRLTRTRNVCDCNVVFVD